MVIVPSCSRSARRSAAPPLPSRPPNSRHRVLLGPNPMSGRNQKRGKAPLDLLQSCAGSGISYVPFLTVDRHRKEEKVGTLRTNRVVAALGTAGVVTALLLGSVTVAQARPVNHAQAVRAAREYVQTQAFSF